MEKKDFISGFKFVARMLDNMVLDEQTLNINEWKHLEDAIKLLKFEINAIESNAYEDVEV